MNYKRKPSPSLLRIFPAVVALLAIAPAAPVLAAPSATSVERGDAAFLLARDAFRNGERVRLGRQLGLLQGHVLQPWAEYWSLRLRLDDGNAEGIPDYLNRHAASLPRREIARRLAARAGQGR
jgi:soluble lytic murein transglycosylase